MTKTLRVNEIFTSIQGEGHWTGVPCTFIRLQGCTLKCTFCDSKSTWDLSGGTEMAIHEIIHQILPTIQRVVVTGGEPTLQENVVELVQELIRANYFVHIETSGTYYAILKKLRSMPHVWITISPKKLIPTSRVLLLADEIKWVIRRESDLWMMDEIFDELTHRTGDFPPTFFLQPVSQEPEATELCVKHIIQNAHREYRLSIQIHRYIGVR